MKSNQLGTNWSLMLCWIILIDILFFQSIILMKSLLKRSKEGETTKRNEQRKENRKDNCEGKIFSERQNCTPLKFSKMRLSSRNWWRSKKQLTLQQMKSVKLNRGQTQQNFSCLCPKNSIHWVLLVYTPLLPKKWF